MSTLRAKQFHLIDDMDIAAATLSLTDRVGNFVVKVNQVLRTWVRRSKDRRMLAQMNERMMNDIGLTPYDIRLETEKYFWQK